MNSLFEQFDKYFSSYRTYRYKEIDCERHVDLYFYNQSISQDLFYIISTFEVIFRNHINNVLIEIYGHEYFEYLSKYLSERDRSYFEEIERHKKNNNCKYDDFRNISNFQSKMLSSITLGVWIRWFKEQDHKTYVSYLSKCFTKSYRSKYKYKQIINNLNIVYETRNKIAHHERLLNKGLNVEKRSKILKDITLGIIDDSDSNLKIYIKNKLDSKCASIRSILEKTN